MPNIELTDTQWVSRRLRAARSLLGVTQQEFATGAGVDLAIIVETENGALFPDTLIWSKLLTYLRENGIRPTEFGVEFDRDKIEPPERAKLLWSYKVMTDPLFPG